MKPPFSFRGQDHHQQILKTICKSINLVTRIISSGKHGKHGIKKKEKIVEETGKDNLL